MSLQLESLDTVMHSKQPTAVVICRHHKLLIVQKSDPCDLSARTVSASAVATVDTAFIVECLGLALLVVLIEDGHADRGQTDHDPFTVRAESYRCDALVLVDPLFIDWLLVID